MIVFDLKCTQNHVFEVWFQNSQVFESQREAAQIICPYCGDTKIEKAIMAPNISVGGHVESRAAGAETTPPTAGQSAVTPFPMAPDYRKMLESFREIVARNCDYVGAGFAEEARKIHYGEAEQRGIYGEATPEESRDLNEEGIAFFQLPLPAKTDS